MAHSQSAAGYRLQATGIWRLATTNWELWT